MTPKKNAFTSTASRRTFLTKAGAAAATGFAMPYIIPSGVLARDGQPGANDKIGVAGVGIGRQGSGVLGSAVKSPKTRFVGIADVNLPRAKQMCDRFGGGEAVQNYHDILDRSDVDAIVTATPEQWRVNICVEACQAGKDIYAEKPVSFTILEGRLMTQAARKYKRVFQVGSQQRSMQTNILACQFIRDGGMGKVHKVYVMRYPSPYDCALPAQPIPEGLDWDMWCGPAPLTDYHPELYVPRGKPGWLSFKPFSGGEMTGWGAHGFDMVQMALGMDTSGPTEVWVEGKEFKAPTVSEPTRNVEPNVIANDPTVYWKYANGVVVEMEEGYLNQGGKPPGRVPGFGGIFECEKGTATIDRGKFTTDPPELAKEALKNRGKEYSHVENWLDCIETRESPNADIEIGHRSATVCHLGNIARYENRSLKWSPDSERFEGDESANSHLDYERREPYGLPTV